VSGVGDFELSELFEMGVHDVSEATKQARSISWRDAAPSRRYLRGEVDRSVGLLEVVHGHRGNLFFRCWVDDA